MENNGKHLHVWIADDDEDDTLLFADALGEVGAFNLTCLGNGMELMSRLHRGLRDGDLPDIVFLDLNMPLKNGIECLSDIKSAEMLNRIPIVIFSTSAQAEVVDDAYHEGAALYLKKPESFPKLKEALQKILSIDWKTFSQPFPRERFFWRE